ncbi:MAG: hypothetical protein JL50_10070 [Peptococcaceae bacterium BICA1-7]|nr:MAG: hypothetical protein JL50_10070 [Peptococcaceae bacterium BICA1-7]HBV95629.1 hypothetical protein [Desulfotomaculum sp.]
MPEYTTNYNLIKPLDNETADIADINQNMDIIDGQMLQNANAVAAHLAETMPHQFTDGATTYRWGLAVIDGVVNFVYEEVV